MARRFSDGSEFAMPLNRPDVTLESESDGHHDSDAGEIDWIGMANQGGGHVPEDFEWRSMPKQMQEETSHG